MNVRQLSICLLSAALAIASASASVQKTDSCCPYYDKEAEVTILGVVEQVERKVGQSGVYRTHLLVNQKDELYDVYLGPAKFVRKLGLSPKVGDGVIVVGALAEAPTASEHKELIARSLSIGDKLFELRDATGRPLWRRGQPTR